MSQAVIAKPLLGLGLNVLGRQCVILKDLSIFCRSASLKRAIFSMISFRRGC